MDNKNIERFYSKLLELNGNKSRDINNIAECALKCTKDSDNIVKILEKYLYRVSGQILLPLLYVVDAIVKNDECGIYAKQFSARIVHIFAEVFKKVNEKTREAMYKLRHTWNKTFLDNVLYDLDMTIHTLDPNWPIVAKPQLQPVEMIFFENENVSEEDEDELSSTDEVDDELSSNSSSISSSMYQNVQEVLSYNTTPDLNIMVSVAVGVYQFIKLHRQQEKISRSPKNTYIAERNHKGRFTTSFEDLLKSECKFKENFHMDSETFFCLFDLVEERLRPKRNTHPKDGISAKEKLAVVLEYFACGSLQRHIASVYRISKQHFGKILDDVCNAICTALKSEIPAISSGNLKANAETFLKWDFPNCLGALDGKHVSIKCPPKSGSLFYNYKGYFSIVLMAVANGDYSFAYFDIGAYGSEGDAGIFRNCSLGKAIKQNILPFPSSNAMGYPYVFVADDAFPLHHRIMKPYKPTRNAVLDEEKQIFNYRLSRARRCVENAFGIMCSKNVCLSKTMFCAPDRAKKIIKTCVYLHNFMIRTRKRKYCHPLLPDTETKNGEVVRGRFRHALKPDSLFFSDINYGSQGRSHESGIIVRDTIKDYFNSEEGSLPWQRKYAYLE
ncbi:uncharacterized protein LOC142221434 [Haematobia irritans]|uniref:uncharacterized protein LOC142221434 n=1 Tax=Haematobia irritans TaxID=7368 RepID=UPI003F4F4D8B